MLTVSNLTKSYDAELVFQGVSFNLNPGERLGLIGPNGCGKTTLLRILAGLEKADAGRWSFDPPGLQAGYLPQGLALSPDFSLPGESIQSFLMRRQGDPIRLSARLEELAAHLAGAHHQVSLSQEYDRVLAQLEAASESAVRIPSTLAALGLASFPTGTPVAHLSGGQKTRLALAGVLLSNPQLLLLDEPTNHLDLGMLEWLENWLASFRGAALIVSHDRAFLDGTTTGILEMDLRHPHHPRLPGQLHRLPGAKAGRDRPPVAGIHRPAAGNHPPGALGRPGARRGPF